MQQTLNKYLSTLKRSYYIDGEKHLSYLYIPADNDISVVFLHGIPSSAELWRDTLTIMHKNNFNVYAPDLPGYGNTYLEDKNDYSLKGAADLISKWIKHQLNKPVWLIGHDIGGAIAQIIAVKNPQLIQRLTLCNCPFDKSWPVLPVKIFRFIAKIGLYPVTAKSGLLPNPYTIRKMRKAFFNSRVLSKERINRIFWNGKVFSEQGRIQFARHLKALDNNNTAEIANDLKDINIPTQIIWADRDYYQSWNAVGFRLSKVIKKSSTTIIKESGHYLPLEKPAEFCDTLISWHENYF